MKIEYIEKNIKIINLILIVGTFVIYLHNIYIKLSKEATKIFKKLALKG